MILTVVHKGRSETLYIPCRQRPCVVRLLGFLTLKHRVPFDGTMPYTVVVKRGVVEAGSRHGLLQAFCPFGGNVEAVLQRTSQGFEQDFWVDLV